MSNYLETDFCEPEEGLDYIFGYMSAVYGAGFTRHWENVDPDLVRSVWQKELGRYATYKPSLQHALDCMPARMPPSAIEFRNLCRNGPGIPTKPSLKIEHQPTEYEKARSAIEKDKALAKLRELKRQYTSGILTNHDDQ